MTRKFIVSSIFAAVTAAMSAVPASDSPILRTLPDGTSIEIMLHGDENFHYATLLDGSIVKEGDDGYFYYAEVTADGIVATPYKVGDNVPKQRVVKSTGVKNRLQALRSQALQRRAVKPHAAQRSASDINSQHGLVILVDYPDMPMVQTNKDYSEMLNSEGYSKNYATGSALDYFRNSSYGKYSPVFDVFGPYTLSNKYRYYGKNDASGGDTNVPEMIVEACRMASADVDLSTYDYDNDGYIDNVYVFYAGAGEANGGSDDTVWPHRWVVYGENYDGDPDVGGVKVYDYACSNEIRESLKNKIGTNLEGIGTFVHEFGHVLGFSDHYSTNDNNLALDPGYYDVMASASYLNYGRTPYGYSAYERMYMGWLEPTQIFPSRDGDKMTLKTIDEGEALLVTADGSTHNMDGVSPSPANYYLIENRASAGWDSFAGYYGTSGTPGDKGMLVTKINYDADRWERNIVNAYANQMGIELVCNPVQKKSYAAYYPMFPGSKTQTSVSFGTYSIKNITRDAVTGEVSFTISDSNGYSGVADVEAEADVYVYAADGAIVVEGAAGRVSVSTLQGALVYDGIGGRIPVATGLYVVNVDGKAVKVAVR